MLTQQTLAPVLLEHRFLHQKTVVEGDLTILDASRRNRNFKVISRDGPSYLVKQGLGPEGTATVYHEALVYQFLQSGSDPGAPGGYLPRFYGYLPEERLLILELIPGARSLAVDYSRHRFSRATAAAIGEALGRFHRVPAPDPQTDAALRVPSPPPWILSVHRPHVSIFSQISGANLQLIRMLQ